jgi:hypothetical protein
MAVCWSFVAPSVQLTVCEAQSPAETPGFLVIIMPLLLLLLVYQQARLVPAPYTPAVLLGLSTGWLRWLWLLAAVAADAPCC